MAADRALEYMKLNSARRRKWAKTGPNFPTQFSENHLKLSTEIKVSSETLASSSDRWCYIRAENEHSAMHSSFLWRKKTLFFGGDTL